jgi:hypothetical protein
MTWNHFEAEILFLNPADVPRAVEVLAAVGCEFEIDHDAIDDHGPTVFGWATGTTALSEDDIGDWLLAIVDPLGGDVVQWGFKRTPSPAEYKIGGNKS